MSLLRAAILAALFSFPASESALADDVTLTSRDGSLEISGELLGYDGEFFRLDTVYGELTVDGSGVTCSGPGCPDVTAYVAEIRVSGARRLGAVLMPALIESFAARNGYRPESAIESDTSFTYTLVDTKTGQVAARFIFELSSTARGFAAIGSDATDLVLALREPSAPEIEAIREAGYGDPTAHHRSLILGLDALVPIVSAGNPVRRISMEDLARVFAGEISDWSELGAPEGEISLHLRNSGAGVAEVFRDRLLKTYEHEESPAVTRHGTNAELSDAVARDVFAIGVSGLSAVGNAVAMGLEGSCGIFSEANETSLKTEDYPLTTPLFIYLPPRRLPLLAREFLRYVRGPAAQPVIRRAGFVDLGYRTIDLEGQGVRLANAISAAGEETDLTELQRLVWLMRGVRRLTIAFRFRNGTTELDPQSRSNVELLADLLEAREFNDQRLTFVGFSDGQGAAAANLALSRRRADSVRAAVLRAAPLADLSRLSLAVEAFGEAMPMACDDTEWGRGINRRVEVWVSHK